MRLMEAVDTRRIFAVPPLPHLLPASGDLSHDRIPPADVNDRFTHSICTLQTAPTWQERGTGE